MNKRNIVLLILTLVLLAVIFILASKIEGNDDMINTHLIIGDSTYDVVLKEGSSIEDQLRGAEITFSVTENKVVSMNGVSSTDRCRWVYEINDSGSTTDISKYLLSENDIVLWNYNCN